MTRTEAEAARAAAGAAYQAAWTALIDAAVELGGHDALLANAHAFPDDGPPPPHFHTTTFDLGIQHGEYAIPVAKIGDRINERAAELLAAQPQV
ncbi:MAG: hypothetical protein KDG52_21720 [Rhodocyclaceae bacterium]|nr:hypothetical protein [Rhodocyclaceae bacterium]